MEKFSYEKNGYNRSEVNSFVSEVIHETEKLLAVIKHQKKEIEELTLELNECKLKQNELNDIIESTEKMKKEINTLLEEKKELIINTAKRNASKIVNDALIEANKLEKALDICMLEERKLKITGRSDGATTKDFGSYVMSTIENI